MSYTLISINNVYSLTNNEPIIQNASDSANPEAITGQFNTPLKNGPTNIDAKKTWPTSLLTPDQNFSFDDCSIYYHNISHDTEVKLHTELVEVSPRAESDHHLLLRTELLYPLSYEGENSDFQSLRRRHIFYITFLYKF